jgi:glycosyltransferase involved in cell wall biosynthesis
MPNSTTNLPVVSIIVTVRDGWDQTFQALLSIVETTCGIATETIVVDDGSSDETARALPLMPGIVAVRSDAPAGLVRARAEGAALARGEVLVFLGNGVTLRSGWLEPLLAAFQDDPLLGAAQPAGAPLASDGLAVRAEVFRRLGGLDPAFRERLAELDLCFRLEAQGLRRTQLPDDRLQVTVPWGTGLAPWPADEALLVSRWGEQLSRATSAQDAGARASRPELRPGDGPMFSVLVPCYNQAHFLTAALDSLLAQTCNDWEALVVDDGSSDATSEVAQAYALRDPRVRAFRKANGGVASALNRGLSEARGEWICWLSADDLFLPGKLALHRDAIQADPGLRFMLTNFDLRWEETGRQAPSGLAVATFIPPVEQQVIRLLHINYFNGITVALHRPLFQAMGGFDEEFRYGQDYDLWLRTSAQVRSRFIDQATAVTRLHPGQGTALFSEAGIYDSARAGAAFLNRHALRALFPVLDLDRPDHALHATVTALRVLIDPSAYVTRCGFSSLLVDRLQEFLAQAPAPVRQQVQAELGRALARPDTDATAAALIQPLLSVTPGSRAFEPRDPLALLEQHAVHLERTGHAKELAALQRYLRMISDTRARGLEGHAA